MLTMNLREWSTLTIDQRNTWIDEQSSRKLTEILGALGEMLIEADTMDSQLAMLTEPSQEILNARNFTYNTLRDAEHFIVAALNNRKSLERTV